MSKGQLGSIEEDAARMGFMKKRLPPDFRRVLWHLTCSKCPNELTANWGPEMKPEGMRKFTRQKAWDVDYGMRPLCPDCIHAKDKGPLVKPEHQNFKPWVPPRTQIFDKLLIAAEERAFKEKLGHDIELLLEAGLDVEDKKAALADAKDEKRAITRQAEIEARRAAVRERISIAQKARWARIRQTKIASAEAMRIAQLKERACGTISDSSPLHFHIPPQEAPQAEEEVINMRAISPILSPSPKITHAVFQLLDGVFDPAKRLYKSGYTDQRVAKEAGTSEDVVLYLRTETFGQLAEDPRLGNIRDDLELLGMDAAEKFAALQKALGELRSRIEQVARK